MSRHDQPAVEVDGLACDAGSAEAGHVSGTIIRVHTRDFDYNGHTHRASPEPPQYEIKSGKTDLIAAHKGLALGELSD